MFDSITNVHKLEDGGTYSVTFKGRLTPSQRVAIQDELTLFSRGVNKGMKFLVLDASTVIATAQESVLGQDEVEDVFVNGKLIDYPIKVDEAKGMVVCYHANKNGRLTVAKGMTVRKVTKFGKVSVVKRFKRVLT